jgi:hypothetical protein
MYLSLILQAPTVSSVHHAKEQTIANNEYDCSRLLHPLHN